MEIFLKKITIFFSGYEIHRCSPNNEISPVHVLRRVPRLKRDNVRLDRPEPARQRTRIHFRRQNQRKGAWHFQDRLKRPEDHRPERRGARHRAEIHRMIHFLHFSAKNRAEFTNLI